MDNKCDQKVIIVAVCDRRRRALCAITIFKAQGIETPLVEDVRSPGLLYYE
ncbi:hypothetical protein HW132_10435 [Brasilonema sp. CT11]|nr:hypothetical protein [Brasilonema sp. CT11]